MLGDGHGFDPVVHANALGGEQEIRMRMTMRLKRTGHDIRQVFRNLVTIDLGGGTEDTLLLAGSRRSGTTWLSTVINYRRKLRYVFEPLHSEFVPECRGRPMFQYVRPDATDSALKDLLDRLLSGKVSNRWTNRENQCRISRKRLVKIVRANFMLKYIRREFPRMPIVFVLRHPCAVAASQLRTPRGKTVPIEEQLEQSKLVEDHLAPFLDTMTGREDLFERQIVWWCMENYVPLRQLESGDAHVVFYETMCTQPEGELESLFGFLGLKLDEGVWKQFRRPSSMSGGWSAIRHGQDLIESWRKRVSESQVKEAVRIIESFGLGHVYGAESMPRTPAAELLRPSGSEGQQLSAP